MKHALYKPLLKSLGCIFVLCLLFACAPKVFAEESYLITTKPELESAIANAKDGDTILVGDITFPESQGPNGFANISKSVTIKSGKDSNAVFTNATIFLTGTLSNSSPLKITFENIDFHGNNFGISLIPDSPQNQSLNFTNIMQTMCAAIISQNVDVTYTGCSFEGYHYGYGGVISATYSKGNNYLLKITLDRCTFRNNAATHGGCIYLCGYGHNVFLDARHCIFESNAASTGGAIWACDSNINLLDCNFINNHYLATHVQNINGGAMAFDNCAAELDGCLIANNSSLGYGAGIYSIIAPFKTLIMENCTVIGNTSSLDEGIYTEASKTNFDTPATAHIYFCSLFGKQVLDENAELFGCLLVNKNEVLQEPNAENGYCLELTSKYIHENGLMPTEPKHVSLHENEYLIPKESIAKVANSKFLKSIGNFHIGDNYKKDITIKIKNSHKKAENITLQYGDEISLGAPEMKGYSFQNWEYPKGTAIESDLVFIGGELPEEIITARFDFVLSENLYVIWLPLLVLFVACITFFIFHQKKKKDIVTPEERITEENNQKERTPTLPCNWISNACELPEIATVLSKREKEVLQKLLEGKSRKQIADDLFVTEATIKKHSASIYSKLEVHNRTELIYKLTKQ